MPTPAEQLCLTCGLCCDGTLFTRVPLEAGAMVPAALTVQSNASGGRWLKQPCSALEAGRCTVYAERPTVCRSFRCLLLEALTSGEVQLAEAQRMVDEAHARIEALRRELPDVSGVSVLQAGLEAAAAQTASACALEALARLKAYVRSTFTGRAVT